MWSLERFEVGVIFLNIFLHLFLLAKHCFLKNSCHTTLFLLDLFWFEPKFGFFSLCKITQLEESEMRPTGWILSQLNASWQKFLPGLFCKWLNRLSDLWGFLTSILQGVWFHWKFPGRFQNIFRPDFIVWFKKKIVYNFFKSYIIVRLSMLKGWIC